MTRLTALVSRFAGPMFIITVSAACGLSSAWCWPPRDLEAPAPFGHQLITRPKQAPSAPAVLEQATATHEADLVSKILTEPDLAMAQFAVIGQLDRLAAESAQDPPVNPGPSR